THVDLIIRAGWIVPVEPAGVVYEDHCLAVSRGRIVAILPEAETRARCLAKAEVHLPNHVVIPGLVNTHTHAAMTLFRCLADDLPLMTWLQEHIWPAESTWVSENFARHGTELAVAEMIRSGTTCF